MTEQTMEYGPATLILEDVPFACGYGYTEAKNVLCQDGQRRNAHASSNGIPDTFFSVPMFVYVGKVRVYGYVTPDDDDVRFIAHRYRKHHELVGSRP